MPPDRKSSLVVSRTQAGRGVFALEFIPAGCLLHIDHLLVLPLVEVALDGVISRYMYRYTEGAVAIPLGLGSLYNHSESPNVTYTLEPGCDEIWFYAASDILPGDELCHFYGNDEFN